MNQVVNTYKQPCLPPPDNVLHFKPRYFVLATALFVIEVLIALFVRDTIIRPYIGDVLVVMLIYCFFRSFLKISVVSLAVITLLFSYVVEVSQYFKIVKLLGLQKSAFASTVLGTSFSWIDMLCYTIGVIIILIVEKINASGPMH